MKEDKRGAVTDKKIIPSIINLLLGSRTRFSKKSSTAFVFATKRRDRKTFKRKYSNSIRAVFKIGRFTNKHSSSPNIRKWPITKAFRRLAGQGSTDSIRHHQARQAARRSSYKRQLALANSLENSRAFCNPLSNKLEGNEESK